MIITLICSKFHSAKVLNHRKLSSEQEATSEHFHQSHAPRLSMHREWELHIYNDVYRFWTENQRSRKSFMVHQTSVQWALFKLFKFMKSLIRHLSLAIGNVSDVPDDFRQHWKSMYCCCFLSKTSVTCCGTAVANQQWVWIDKMIFHAHDGLVSDVVIAYFSSYNTIWINLPRPAECGFVMENFSILWLGAGVAEKTERGKG